MAIYMRFTMFSMVYAEVVRKQLWFSESRRYILDKKEGIEETQRGVVNSLEISRKIYQTRHYLVCN
jgi:hypothetical protein